MKVKLKVVNDGRHLRIYFPEKSFRGNFYAVTYAKGQITLRPQKNSGIVVRASGAAEHNSQPIAVQK